MNRYLKNKFRNFFASETGAVTVDWVVLTAGAVVLASVLIQYTRTSILDISDVVEAGVENPLGD